jgi:LPXTG-motif cell wall-anchored protein
MNGMNINTLNDFKERISNCNQVSIVAEETADFQLVTPITNEICNDNIDNDNNGLIDCNDLKCTNAENCKQTDNTLLYTGIGVSTILVGAGALIIAKRKKKR